MPRLVLRRTLAVVLVATAAAILAASEPAAASTLDISYGISFWDVPFGSTNYNGVLGNGTYSAKAHFETGGMIGVFWKSIVDATANGDIGAQSISPVLYDSYSKNRDRPLQRMTVTFQNNGPVTFSAPTYDASKYPVSELQKKGTVDPMSAVTSIFAGTKADERHPCGSGAQVFDGRRRYDLTLTYLRDEPVVLSNGLFNGGAHLCEIGYKTVAGYPQRIVSNRRPPPRIFADFIDVPVRDAPGGRYVVAIKLWAELSLGTITATLATIKVDGETPPGMIAKN